MCYFIFSSSISIKVTLTQKGDSKGKAHDKRRWIRLIITDWAEGDIFKAEKCKVVPLSLCSLISYSTWIRSWFHSGSLLISLSFCSVSFKALYIILSYNFYVCVLIFVAEYYEYTGMYQKLLPCPDSRGSRESVKRVFNFTNCRFSHKIITR